MADNPNVRRVEFIKSAAAKKDWPAPEGLPEVAIAGRSNVGKSSLINRLVNRRQLARVSNTPGRTQLLNFFRVNDAFVVCDLPGYGFAKVPTAIKKGWGPMIEGYLEGRSPLRVLMVLVDCRREPGDWEIGLVTYCSTRGLALLPVITKMDKVPKNQRFPTLARIGKALGLPSEALVPFSAETGEGLELLWTRLQRLLPAAVEIDAEGEADSGEPPAP
jgi:GTP-binding protein